MIKLTTLPQGEVYVVKAPREATKIKVYSTKALQYQHRVGAGFGTT